MKTIHRQVLEKYIEKYINPDAVATLDVGSKSRRYDYLLKNKSHAIDLTPNKDLGVEAGDITNISFDIRYDQIICFEVLEYLNYPNIVKSLNNLISGLKSDGQLLLSVPFNVAAHDDITRLSELGFKELLNSFQGIDYEVLKFGNSRNVAIDASLFRYKKLKTLKMLYFLPLVFKRMIMKFLKIDDMVDDFYSGVFVIIKLKV